MRISSGRRVRAAALGGTILAAAVALAGCGAGPSEGSPVTDAENAAAVKAARTAADRDLAGIDRDLPADGPRGVPGKSVWVIASNMATEGSKIAAEGAKEAGGALGWKLNVVDAEFDPATAAEQVRSAVSAKADGILLIAIDCAWMPGALKEAKDAGLVIYSQWGLDCDEPLFSGAQVFGADGTTYDQYFVRHFAPALANHLIAETDGEASIVQLDFDQIAVLKKLGDAFNEFVADKCPRCSVARLPISNHDIAQGTVQSKVTAALTRDQDANAVMVPFDGLVLAGVSAAVEQAEAGGDRELHLAGVSGGSPNLKMIKEGGPQTFTAALPNRWGAWASMDGLNRAFAGAEQVDPGIGLRTFDVDHPPASIPYEGNDRSLAWEDRYRRIWDKGSAE